MKIAYTGTSDFQEFSKADFTKANVDDGKAVRFARGVVTEVDEAVGEALTSKEGLFSSYDFTKIEGDLEEGTFVDPDNRRGNKVVEPEVPEVSKSTSESNAQKGASRGSSRGSSGSGTPENS